MRILPLVIAILLAGPLYAQDGSWPRFRGPNGGGVAEGTGYPEKLEPGKNVWKTPVPFGESSPIVQSGKVYLTASEGDALITICLDAASGKELWRREITRERAHEGYSANDPASPTPAADDLGVYVFFPDFGLVAYDPAGEERWRMPLGPFQNFYGMAASPIVASDAVILVCDQSSDSFLIGVNRKTGKVKWKTERKHATIGWATPMIFRPSQGPAQLVVLGSMRLDGYYLETGEIRWWLPVGSSGALGTPVSNGDAILVSTYGGSEPLLTTFQAALDDFDKDGDGGLARPELAESWIANHFGWLDTSGDDSISAAEWAAARRIEEAEHGAIAVRAGSAEGALQPGAVSWRYKKSLPYVAAPLLYDGVYYLVRDGGIISSLNPETGAVQKQGRSRDALGDYFASPVAADGKIYLANAEGKVTVLKAGARWDVLNVSDFGEQIHATPALSAGSVYLRTRGYVYRLD